MEGNVTTGTTQVYTKYILPSHQLLVMFQPTHNYTTLLPFDGVSDTTFPVEYNNTVTSSEGQVNEEVMTVLKFLMPIIAIIGIMGNALALIVSMILVVYSIQNIYN